MATNVSSFREERTISEVRRLSRAGLEATELLQRVARALQRTIPFELYAAATIDPASGLITGAFAEQLADGHEGLRPTNPQWFEHFYFEETFDKTRELVRRRQWATTLDAETNGRPEWSLCYRESMRPAGIEHKAHTIFVDRSLWGDMELYRGTGSAGFTSREIEVVRRVAPDVGAGLKFAALRARAQAEEIDETTPGVLVVDQLGHVSGTPGVETLLGELDELHPLWRDAQHLPVAVQVVLRALRESLAAAPGTEHDVAPRLRVRGRTGRWLALHAACSEATDTRPGERLVVIAPAPPQELMWLGMNAYDLSAREEDVVKLVVGGLSTKQIAERLFIAEHTVQRHLTNIFEKVGVRSRRELVKQLFFAHVLPSAGAA
jgi:DNA-binding CsgD family transcriptional regulator